jgi:hypothetical protein
MKLPAPVLGTDAQPEPKSVVEAGADEPDEAAGAEDDAIGAEDEDAGALAAVLDEDELHAAAPTARAAMPGSASRRRFLFTGFLLDRCWCWFSF